MAARKSIGALKSAVSTEVRRAARPRKLSYKEQRELAALPDKIEALELEQIELHDRMGHSDFYRQANETIAASLERLEAIKRELELCYGRWQELELVAPSTDS